MNLKLTFENEGQRASFNSAKETKPSEYYQHSKTGRTERRFAEVSNELLDSNGVEAR